MRSANSSAERLPIDLIDASAEALVGEFLKVMPSQYGAGLASPLAQARATLGDAAGATDVALFCVRAHEEASAYGRLAPTLDTFRKQLRGFERQAALLLRACASAEAVTNDEAPPSSPMFALGDMLRYISEAKSRVDACDQLSQVLEGRMVGTRKQQAFMEGLVDRLRNAKEALELLDEFAFTEYSTLVGATP